MLSAERDNTGQPAFARASDSSPRRSLPPSQTAVKLTLPPFSAVMCRSVRPSTCSAAARISSRLPFAVADKVPRAASWPASSSGVPCAASFPAEMMSTRSQTVCTSLRIWLDRMTV